MVSDIKKQEGMDVSNRRMDLLYDLGNMDYEWKEVSFIIKYIFIRSLKY